MLGEQIVEERGKVSATRVLPEDGQGLKGEVSFQARGKILGVEETDTGTYWSALRPDGSLFGEGQGVIMTGDGQMVTWKGQGVGKFTSRGSVSWRGAVYYYTSSPKLARLNGVAALFEYEVDESGNTQAKIWEWK